MQIRPIRTDSDHENAVARISELMGAAAGTPQGDELDVLATLVDASEAKNFVIDAPDPVAAIQFRMEQQGLRRRDLEPFIGSRARVSEVLTRKRNLTLEMIRRVKCGLGISADLLIGATPLRGHRPSTARTVQNSSLRSRAKTRTTKQSRKNA
jgi:HTH-type transcriptional regulator/antitoxin HigA